LEGTPRFLIGQHSLGHESNQCRRKQGKLSQSAALDRAELKILTSLQQGHLEWLNLEIIFWLIENGFELRKKSILPQKYPSAEFEVIAKAYFGAELMICFQPIRAQNVYFDRSQISNLHFAGCSFKRPCMSLLSNPVSNSPSKGTRGRLNNLRPNQSGRKEWEW
jgi:hypothetical protein